MSPREGLPQGGLVHGEEVSVLVQGQSPAHSSRWPPKLSLSTKGLRPNGFSFPRGSAQGLPAVLSRFPVYSCPGHALLMVPSGASSALLSWAGTGRRAVQAKAQGGL